MPYYKKEFFASANSGCGFINLFPDIFSKLDHLYIIKGGSGTGKSSLMKKAFKTAENRGYTVERYLCSSDPQSLDGIIIEELGVGIIDGTAPHTADTCYPGAYDEIINTGDYWNTELLTDNKQIIQALYDKKTCLYKKVYEYLYAAYSVKKATDSQLKKCFNTEKAENAVKRLVSLLPCVSRGNRKTVFTKAISMRGYAELTPFYDAKTIYSISDKYGAAELILKMTDDKLSGISRTVGLDALDHESINMIYLDASDILITVNYEKDADKIINMDRFIFKEEYTKVKSHIRSSIKCRKNLCDVAVDILKDIENIHFSLEEIYSGAMDFEAKDCHEEELLKKIFSRY